MITIGLIDDVSSELDDIRVAISESWPEISTDELLDFKVYELKREEGFFESLKEQIQIDIREQAICCLIVDYKLDSMRKLISGSAIVDYVRQIADKFPVIVLTNAPEAGKLDDYIDPDKVYPKKEFLRIDDENSKEMVFRIFRNINRYRKEREQIEAKINDSISKINEESASADVNLQAVIDLVALEGKYDDYCPTEQSKGEKAIEQHLDLEELTKLIAEIRELNKDIE